MANSPQTAANTATATSPKLQRLHLEERNLHCDCHSPQPFFYCCQRAMINVHKMGVVIVQEIRDRYFNQSLPKYVSVETPEVMKDHVFGSMLEREYRIPFSGDYRHVVVTRNWYDTILSGYLYHKSGKECWLDWYGRTNYTGWLWNNSKEDWEQRLLSHHYRNNNLTVMSRKQPWWQPGNGRDLCLYLSQETEDEGLRVYIAWTMLSHLLPILELRRQRLEREKRNGWNRTMFVCYEELVAPTKHVLVMNQLMAWLFPTPLVLFNITNLQQAGYNGGHATNKDPHLRSACTKFYPALIPSFTMAQSQKEVPSLVAWNDNIF